MPTINIDRLVKQADMLPSFVCAACGKLENQMENQNAYIVRGDFWLCPDCLTKLRMLLGQDGDK